MSITKKSDAKLSSWKTLTHQLFNEDRENFNMWWAMDRMWRLEWEFPGIPPKWIIPTTTAGPHNTIKAAVQVISTKGFSLNITPLLNEKAFQELADKQEKALEWHMKLSGKRHLSSVLRQLALPAVKNGKVIQQVIFKPWEKKALGGEGGPLERGDPRFTFLEYDPRNVVDVWDQDGLATVIATRLWREQEFKTRFGEESFKRVAASRKDDRVSDEYKFVRTFDAWDRKDRFLWAVSVPDERLHHHHKDIFLIDAKFGGVSIIDAPHELPFLPWVIRGLRDGQEYTPIMYPSFKAGMWNRLNVLATILTSEVNAYAAAPREAVTSGNHERVETNYGEPGGRIELGPNDKHQQLTPPGIDRGIQEVLQMFLNAQQTSTLSEVILNPSARPDVPFSALVQVTEAASKSIDPYQAIVEEALADTAELMLRWVILSKRTLVAYTEDGEQLDLNPKEFKADFLNVTAKVDKSLPVDQAARANVASLIGQRMQIPNSTLLEMVGVDDPSLQKKMWEQEQIDGVNFQGQVQLVQAANEVELLTRQLQIAQLRQMVQEALAQQAQQQAAGQPPGGGPVGPPNPNAPGQLAPGQAAEQMGPPLADGQQLGPGAAVPEQFAPGVSAPGV